MVEFKSVHVKLKTDYISKDCLYVSFCLDYL